MWILLIWLCLLIQIMSIIIKLRMQEVLNYLFPGEKGSYVYYCDSQSLMPMLWLYFNLQNILAF